MEELVDGTVFHVTPDGRVVAMKERAVETLGEAGDEAVGETVSRFLGDADAERLTKRPEDGERPASVAATLRWASGPVEPDLRRRRRDRRHPPWEQLDVVDERAGSVRVDLRTTDAPGVST